MLWLSRCQWNEATAQSSIGWTCLYHLQAVPTWFLTLRFSMFCDLSRGQAWKGRLVKHHYIILWGEKWLLIVFEWVSVYDKLWILDGNLSPSETKRLPWNPPTHVLRDNVEPVCHLWTQTHTHTFPTLTQQLSIHFCLNLSCWPALISSARLQAALPKLGWSQEKSPSVIVWLSPWRFTRVAPLSFL